MVHTFVGIRGSAALVIGDTLGTRQCLIFTTSGRAELKVVQKYLQATGLLSTGAPFDGERLGLGQRPEQQIVIDRETSAAESATRNLLDGPN